MSNKITNKKCYFYDVVNDGLSICTALKNEEASCRGCVFFRDKVKDARNNALMAAFNRQRLADYSDGLCSKPKTRSI